MVHLEANSETKRTMNLKLNLPQGHFHLFDNKTGLFLNSVGITSLFATGLGFCFIKGTTHKFDEVQICK